VTFPTDLERPGLELRAAVLVVGGGLSATWAAIAAAEAGAPVVLVDKGYAGASGVAAAAGVAHWLVPPLPAEREAEMRQRAEWGAWITDRAWQERVLEHTWNRLPVLGESGYQPARGYGQAPHYLRFLRGLAERLGVKILDHSPALELLVDRDGVVSGARGYRLRTGEFWQCSASAVVLATGGCAWKSKSLGSDVNTGDGHLFAAELGVELSGMEFSGFYGLLPRGTTMDKNGYYAFATFTREDGSVIDGSLFLEREPLLRAALEGPIYAQFNRAPRRNWDAMRANMPNFFMVMDKLRIDPFSQRFAVEFVLQGTVRGTGGLRVEDADCRTSVPGLYIAGDIASREVLVGAASGAGAPNAAWALSSGTWAGRGAARFAHENRELRAGLRGSGGVGLRPTETAALGYREVERAVQSELWPLEKNALRSRGTLAASLQALNTLWGDASRKLHGSGRELVRAREAAAMLALGRYAYTTALAREETRGMHVRSDYPVRDPRQARRLLARGLDQIEISPDPTLPRLSEGWSPA